MVKRYLSEFLFGGRGGATWPAEIGLLVLRVWTGLAIFLGHGLGKVQSPSGFIEGVGENFPLPLLSGWFAILGESLAGILLALGLFTRLGAAWLAAVMFGAAFIVHGGDPLFGRAPTKEMALLFFFPAFCFVLAGSGRTGIDQFFRKK